MGSTRCFGAIFVLTSLLTLSCGDTSQPTTSAAVLQANDENSSVRSLLLTLSARVGASATGELAGNTGKFVDYRHVDRVTLRVDGQAWGTFASDGDGADTPPSDGTPVAGFKLHDGASPALIVAELGRQLAFERPLETAGAWAELLLMHLQPGGHLAEIDAVTLIDDAGASFETHPRLIVPFEIADGATSAFVGELEFSFDGQVEAQ